MYNLMSLYKPAQSLSFHLGTHTERSFGKFGLNNTMLSKKLCRPIEFNHAGWDVWMADCIMDILLATTARSLLYRNSAFSPVISFRAISSFSTTTE